MFKKLIIFAILASAIGFTANQAIAADEPIYGYQLMSEQERIEHRNQMRSMKTNEAREAFRLEHHNRMQERAKAQGVTLPEEPMPRGKGMGQGGNGMGQGGMGQKRSQ